MRTGEGREAVDGFDVRTLVHSGKTISRRYASRVPAPAEGSPLVTLGHVTVTYRATLRVASRRAQA